MMHLFINALAASAGGGLTYIRNVIPYLATTPEVRVTVALGHDLQDELRGFASIDFVKLDAPAIRRFWYEQAVLPDLIRRSHADVLLSAGNFALRNSPLPQILLSRNSLYTSDDFYRDLRSRREYSEWLATHMRAALAKRSIHWAEVTVAPSEAFAAELRRWAGVNVRTIHHGFDQAAFTRDSSPLSSDVEEKLRSADGSLRILFVSPYNYYRNFETLIRALQLLRNLLPGRSIKLLLTCKLAAGQNPGAYRPEAAARLVRSLGVSHSVVELGAIPYSQLHQIYRRADIYATPAYAETFAHPLVEAMASGLPIVASDLAVHREVCGEAALYFPRFSPEALAECVVRLAASVETSSRMAALGLERLRLFSWKTHVDKMLELARTLVRPIPPSANKVGTLL